jgi:hypothetical protein
MDYTLRNIRPQLFRFYGVYKHHNCSPRNIRCRNRHVMKPRLRLFCILLCALSPIGGLFPTGCTSRSAAPGWNLPSIIGQPIDAATRSLGSPTTEAAVSPGVVQSVWKKKGVTLTAQWKSSSKRVISYELVSRDESGALREGETDQLLLAGQLKQSDRGYSTEWIEARDRPLYYVGVKVLPAPKSHTIVLRVTGPQALVQIAYQAGSSSGTFEVIPDWEETLTVADDAKVALQATILRGVEKPLSPMKAEIVVDGKVAASSPPGSNAVECRYEL